MESEETLISWWAWPAKHQPVRACFAWLVVCASIQACAQWSLFLALGIGFALLSSLSEILLPTFYRIQQKQLCIHAIHLYKRLPLSSIHSIKDKEQGFLLNIHLQRSKRKNLFLYCNSNKEKIGWILEQKIAETQTGRE